MSEKPQISIETVLTARASKSLEESVAADLKVEETSSSRAHIKELLRKNDNDQTKVHRD